MKQIALIGSGELGSRHLQSLIRMGTDVSITVVEPLTKSVNLTKTRVEEISSKLDNSTLIDYVDAIDKLPESIDLVIIATSAAPRLTIIKSVLAHAKVTYFVLEKVLFQKSTDYDEATELFEKHGSTVWVNCPRRMFAAYTELKSQLTPTRPVFMNVTGGDWGLACNAIHFIDIFAFLTDSSIVSVETRELEDKIYPSKRDGYIEVFGTLKVLFSSGNVLTLTCSQHKEPLHIQLNNAANQFLINESAGTVHNHGKLTDIKMIVRYQSELSEHLAKEILSVGKAEITTFEESKKMHVTFIEAFLQFYNRIQKLNSIALPIT